MNIIVKWVCHLAKAFHIGKYKLSANGPSYDETVSFVVGYRLSYVSPSHKYKEVNGVNFSEPNPLVSAP